MVSIVSMKDYTQRNSGGTAEVDSVNIKGDNGGCSPTPCSASSFVGEYDNFVETVLKDNPAKGMGEEAEKWMEGIAREACRRVWCGESDADGGSIEKLLMEY